MEQPTAAPLIDYEALLEREAAMRATGSTLRARDVAAAAGVPEAALVEARRRAGHAQALRRPAGAGGHGALLFALRAAGEVMALILAIVAVNAVAGGAIGAMVYVSDDQQLRDLTVWSMGGLGAAPRSSAALAAVCILAAGIGLRRMAATLDLFQIGERAPFHAGLDVERAKIAAAGWSALAVGAGTAVAGPIGFIVPAARRRQVEPVRRPRRRPGPYRRRAGAPPGRAGADPDAQRAVRRARSGDAGPWRRAGGRCDGGAHRRPGAGDGGRRGACRPAGDAAVGRRAGAGASGARAGAAERSEPWIARTNG